VVGILVVLAGPAASAVSPPPNDNRANATGLSLPTTVRGTTVGATNETNDPRPYCGRVSSTVWYRIAGAPSARIVLRLHADGDLDGVMAVYEVRRSHLNFVTCDPTDDNGRAELAFDSPGGGNYLILFGRNPDSVDGTFTLRANSPPRAKPPGAPLPARGVRSSLDPLERPEADWSTVMRAGTTYKLNVVTRRDRCITFAVFPPGTRSFASASPVLRRDCGGYATYTPGPKSGGRYSIFLEARGTRSAALRYRLQVARAGPDDLGPGTSIASLQTRRGALNGSRLDVIDFFHFEVARQSDVTLRLRAGSRSEFDLLLLSETGRVLDCSCGGSSSAYIRRGFAPGNYLVVVRARDFSGGRYRLSLLIREITQTHALVGGSRLVTLSRGQTAGVDISVTPPASGRVLIRIDRFLPLEGWVFSRILNVRTDSGGSARFSWRPPAAGRWRLQAFFQGTRTASPSSSGYLIATVR